MEISRTLNKPLYGANPFWLATNATYEEKDGEPVLYVYDRIDQETYHLFAPQRKEHITLPFIEIASDEDILQLEKSGVHITKKHKIGTEYTYRAKDLIEMKGKPFAAFRKSVHYFQKNYDYRILPEYPEEKTIVFIRTWAATKDLTNYSKLAKGIFEWDLDDCIHYVSLTKKIPHKSIFVEIDGELAGFCMTCPSLPALFVGLQQKVNVRYKGLSRFLYHEKAKLYPETPFFTIGQAADTLGLERFKEEMHPARKIDVYFLKLEI